MIRIFHSADGAIADHNFAARVDQLVALCSGNWATSLASRWQASARANHSYRIPVKLINCRAHLTQDFTQLLLFLTPHSNFDKWNHTHCEYGHDGHCHDELDEGKPVVRV